MLGQYDLKVAIKEVITEIVEVSDITTDVRELHYQGTDFSYPLIRFRDDTILPRQPRQSSEPLDMSWEVIIESEKPSSSEVSYLSQLLVNGLRRKHLDTADVKSGPIRIVNVQGEQPKPQRGWRSRIFCEARAIESWNPTELRNTVLWLDPTTIYGITDGATTEYWRDRSGYENHVRQSVAADRFVYHDDGGANNRPYLEADGVSDYMRTEASRANLQLQVGTIFAVCRVDSGSEVGIVEYIGNYGSGLNGWWMGHRGSGLCAWMIANTTYQEAIGLGTFAQDTWVVAELVIGASAITYLINGTVQDNRVRTLIGNLSYVAGDRLEIGRRDNAGGGTYSNIDYEDIVVNNEELSSTDRSKIRKYLGAKNGITVV